MSFKGSTDQPARIDMFGIGNYISGLCSFITDCDTPMTIAIQGDWGSGKTSVMEMVRDTIDPKAVHCVWFNTWQFSQFNTVDSLSLSLIETVIKGLGIEGGEQADNIRSGIGRLGSVMANVGKRALYVASDLTLGSSTTEDIKTKLDKKDTPADKTVSETISTLKDRFQECVDEAIKKHGVERIVVFIDDLDRLQPLHAVELLEVLKIFLDCEKCVFILAIDYNVVVSGVKSKYGADFKADKGRSFFDKIIQVPFKMPVAQYDISSFVKKTFEDVTACSCSDTDIKNYVALINCSIGSNPRSMKRLFNSYLLLLKVVDKVVLEKDNTSRKALFAILCMQQRFESLYNYIVMNREDIGADFFNNLVASDNISAVLNDENIITEDSEPERIQEFMKHFNKTIGTTGKEDVDEDSINRLRVMLNCSSVTATESSDKSDKKRPTFIYKGEKYQSRGANKMNLSNLALRLIHDYIKDTDKTADEFMEMINKQIPCYYNSAKKLGLGQIAEVSNPLLKHKDAEDCYFEDKNDIVKFGNKEMLVLTGWGAWELSTLINLLGYEGKVNSNVG
jgi:predicted KAP-like P-loop ATPase